MKEQKHEEYFDRGIQTFMKSDYVGLRDLQGYDVAFVGAPVEFGATFRKGAAEGPSEIRRYSHWDTVMGEEYYDLDEEASRSSNDIKIADLGDIHVIPTNPRKTGKIISETVEKIRTVDVFPLIAGGDHSIAYYTIRGCLGGLREKEMAVIHLDAHMDLEDSYLDYPKIHHGSSFRRLIEDGIISGGNLFSVGVRGIIPNDMYRYAREKQVNVYTSNLVRKDGIAKILENIKQKLRECRIKAVYVSLDIDCIDPSEVRGTGTPLEGGLSSEEIFYFVRGLRDIDVVGFEIVELAPKIDSSGFSTLVAVNILRNFLMFGFRNKESIK
jgi:agmatinase